MNDPAPAVNDARKSTLYLLVGCAISWLPMPLSGLAVLPLAASLFYTLRHVTRLRRAGAPPAVRNSAVFGACLTTLLIVLVAAPLVNYARTLRYQECMWGANTHQAAAACKSQHHEEHSGGITGFFLN